MTLRVLWTTWKGTVGEGRTLCPVECITDGCRLADPGSRMELWKIRMFFSLSSPISSLFAAPI